MEQYGLSDEDVVISGMAMHFPGASNFVELSTKLNGNIPIRPKKFEKVPSGFLGDMPGNGRLIDNVYSLDHIFFGLNKAASGSVTYLTRKLLEKVFEALLDAGLNPVDVHNIVCDVYQNELLSDGELVDIHIGVKDPYAITGRSRAMDANRLSFFLNAKGRSASRDCGYLGGLQGIEMAAAAIRAGHADMAIVCGGNLNSDSQFSLHYHHLGYLSMDGKNRSFDNDASGFVRSEGVGVFILQRAKYAKRVYAKIRHVSVSSEIKGTSLSKQYQDSWEKMLKDFYGKSKISTKHIAYYEAYGCGIKEMDAVELNAVSNVLCEGRNTPLLIGSIKSNVGHLEGGADFASIVKAICCLENGFVPGNEDYNSPNRNAHGLINGKLKVVEQNTAIPANGLVAVSGWTVGGIYGHIVLEGFQKVKQQAGEINSLPRLVPIAARTDDLVLKMAQQLERKSFDPEYYHLITDVFRRKIDMFLGRGYVVLPKQETSVIHYQVLDESKRSLWFVFSGMGSQWVGMGKSLLNMPIVKESIYRCHRILQNEGIDLINILTTADPKIFDNITYSFVGIAAIQIALIDILKLLQLKPDGMIGHSVGELGCAYADGCLTAEEMIMAAYYRGKASNDATLERGFMAAVGKGYQDIKNELPEGVEVACHNSSSSCTLSGPTEAVLRYVEDLKNRGIFARAVNVANIAYHSKLIQPAAPFLLQYLQKTILCPKLRSKKWISSSVREEDWETDLSKWCSPEYLTNNLTSSVLFEEASRHIPDNAVVIEVAPHGLLQPILKRSLSKDSVNISLTNRVASDPLVYLLDAIGKIYSCGFEIDVNALYPKIEYPVSKGTESIQPLIHWIPNGSLKPEDFVQKLNLNMRKVFYDCDSSMIGYTIGGNRLLPISTYIYLIEENNKQFERCLDVDLPLSFKNVRMTSLTAFNPDDVLLVDGSFLRGSNQFQISTVSEFLVVSGDLHVLDDDYLKEVPVVPVNKNMLIEVEKNYIYHWFKKQGYLFPETLHMLKSIALTPTGLRGIIPAKSSRYGKLEGLLQLVMFDVCSREKKIVFPYFIQELSLYPIAESNEDLEVFYDRIIGAVSCPGYYLSGIKLKEMSPLDSPLSFRSISINNSYFDEIHEFLLHAFNIIDETVKASGQINAVEVHDSFPNLLDKIKNEVPNIKMAVENVKDSSDLSSDSSLIVCNSQRLSEFVNHANHFILVKSISTISIPPDFEEIAHLKSESYLQLSLLKKKITMNEELEYITIPKSKTDLLYNIKSIKNKSSLLVVGFEDPAEGIVEFKQYIQDQTKIEIKWLFILDKDAPEFSTKSMFYRQQLSYNLPLSILKNGQWFYEYTSDLFDAANSKMAIQSDFTMAEQKDNNINKMGVLKFNSILEYDPLLTWPLPTSWNGKPVESVPVAYSLAYHCFKVLGNVKPYDRVLVTDGFSVGGQAAISVALSITNRVFATVANKQQAHQLKAIFPNLNIEDIILHSDKSFGLRLKLIAKESNPEIIYNFFDGAKFQTCYENVAEFGKIFHFGRDDLCKNTVIGMSTFLRYVSLYAVTPNQINNWSDDDKQIVQGLISEGIKNGVVKPPVLLESSNHDYFNSNIIDKKVLESPFKWQRKFINETSSYVVIGQATDVDIDVIEWLLCRGAKNVFISNKFPINSQYQKKLKCLQLMRGGYLKVINEDELKKILATLDIDVIFFVNMSDYDAELRLSILDDKLIRQTKLLVTISKCKEIIFRMKKSNLSNQAQTNIVWQADNDMIISALHVIEPLFGIEPNILVSNDGPKRLNVKANRLIKDLIPDTIEKYLKLGKSLKNEASLVELPNAGQRENYKSEVSPIFIIPGFEDDPIEIASPIARNIPYTTYVATIPTSHLSSLSTIASVLLPMLKNMQGNMAFNIVGLTSGCALALELTRQLENEGASVALLLVDNISNILQLGIRSKEDFESSFLDAHAILSTKQVDTVLQSSLPWTAHLNHIISFMELPPSTDCWITHAASFMHKYFSLILDYKMENLRIKGPLSIVRTSDDSHRHNYNKMCLESCIVESDSCHKNILQSEEISSIIARFAITEDMAPSQVHKCLWPEFEELLNVRRSIDRV